MRLGCASVTGAKAHECAQHSDHLVRWEADANVMSQGSAADSGYVNPCEVPQKLPAVLYQLATVLNSLPRHRACISYNLMACHCAIVNQAGSDVPVHKGSMQERQLVLERHT